MEARGAPACFRVILWRSHEGLYQVLSRRGAGDKAEVPQMPRLISMFLFPLPPHHHSSSIWDPNISQFFMCLLALALSILMRPLTSCQGDLGCPPDLVHPSQNSCAFPTVFSLAFNTPAISPNGLSLFSPDSCPTHPHAIHSSLRMALQAYPLLQDTAFPHLCLSLSKLSLPPRPILQSEKFLTGSSSQVLSPNPEPGPDKPDDHAKSLE